MKRPRRLPAVKMIDGTKRHVDEFGLTDCQLGTPPNASQVAAAHRWLIERIGGEGFIRTPNRSSYNLKHAAERWHGDYIGNGALIVAASQLGYRMRPARYVIGEPRNAMIGVLKRHYESLEEYPGREAVES